MHVQHVSTFIALALLTSLTTGQPIDTISDHVSTKAEPRSAMLWPLPAPTLTLASNPDPTVSPRSEPLEVVGPISVSAAHSESDSSAQASGSVGGKEDRKVVRRVELPRPRRMFGARKQSLGVYVFAAISVMLEILKATSCGMSPINQHASVKTSRYDNQAGLSPKLEVSGIDHKNGKLTVDTAGMASEASNFSSLPVLDLSLASDDSKRPALLSQLRDTLFNVGFLYVINHGVPQKTIDCLTDKLPTLFELTPEKRSSLSKLNSPHFLGYSGFAEETTLGVSDLREQFDYATELPVAWKDPVATNGSAKHGPNGIREGDRDFSKPYWRLRGPNQWPSEEDVPGFRDALMNYHDAVARLSYDFVHLIEEAFGIPLGTFDHFFRQEASSSNQQSGLPPQHRLKLLKYPPSDSSGQGVGAHKDSSGWLTFLYQVGNENALEVVNGNGDWISAPPIKGSFVVNFGNAFEVATEGAVRATIHRVKATTPSSPIRYSIPFFQGLPLDLTLSEIRSYIPQHVRSMRREHDAKKGVNPHDEVSAFLDPRWDSLGESQLRKWIRSHRDVARKWYGNEVADFYLTCVGAPSKQGDAGAMGVYASTYIPGLGQSETDYRCSE
ncbi:MAG: hypothetical protein M1828_000966 [Chrysothrix sp. TS-e1954]|nr:MAG: hypothetical protein M1828_000966 [Chrysothrix sp. TS-e1954]